MRRQAAIGPNPNAVFKCPDGYAGLYHPRRTLPRAGGYDDYECLGNPFSNKIILMDEVHNLVPLRRDPPQPTAHADACAAARHDQGCYQFRRRRLHSCRPATRSTVKVLKAILWPPPRPHGRGLPSYYMDTPSAVFPAVLPGGVPRRLPEATLRPVKLRNFAGRRPPDRGAADGRVPTAATARSMREGGQELMPPEPRADGPHSLKWSR